MKKILFVMLCCLCLCGCGSKEIESNNSNEYICNKIRYTNTQIIKDILMIEHSNDVITNVISKIITKSNDDDLERLKEFAEEIDYVSCELGDYNYCNTYILEDSLVIIQEMAFLPNKSNLTEYLNFVQENGYSCTQYSIFDTNSNNN